MTAIRFDDAPDAAVASVLLVVALLAFAVVFVRLGRPSGSSAVSGSAGAEGQGDAAGPVDAVERGGDDLRAADRRTIRAVGTAIGMLGAYVVQRLVLDFTPQRSLELIGFWVLLLVARRGLLWAAARVERRGDPS